MALERYRVVIKINGEYPDMFDDNHIRGARIQCVSMQALLHVIISQSALRPMSRYTPLYHELARALDYILTEYFAKGDNIQYIPTGSTSLVSDSHGEDGGFTGCEIVEYAVQYNLIICDLIVEGPISDSTPPPEDFRTQAFTIFSGYTSKNVVCRGGFEMSKLSKGRKALNAFKEKKSKAGHAIKHAAKSVNDFFALARVKCHL